MKHVASSCLTGVILNPIVLWVLGSCALLLGLFVLLDVSTLRERAAEIEQTPLHNMTHMQDRATGTQVLFEGHIAPSNQQRYGDFVAYIRDEYRQRSWRELERVLPPIELQLVDGRASIENISSFDITTETLQEPATRVTRGSVRVRGLRHSDALLVRGTIIATTPQPIIADAWVYTGTQESYAAWQRAAADRSLLGGGGLSVFGILALAIGGWRFAIFLREVRAAQAAQNQELSGLQQPRRRGRRA